MISTKKQAFTLVELIVVITILAILGTIAFISLQGYSADARNSKRVQDLNNISSAINLQSTQGTSLTAFVTSVPANVNDEIDLIGTGSVTVGTDYDAGTVNHTALGIKASDFQDPNGGDYRIGVTTLKNGSFELASKYEEGSSTVAKVTGTYTSRAATATGEMTSTGDTSGISTVVITNSDIGKFFIGDFVQTTDTATGTITDISDDGSTLTLDFVTTGTGINLSTTESDGLIEGDHSDGLTGTGMITDAGDYLPY